jgi:hypothetical protein
MAVKPAHNNLIAFGAMGPESAVEAAWLILIAHNGSMVRKIDGYRSPRRSHASVTVSPPKFNEQT